MSEADLPSFTLTSANEHEGGWGPARSGQQFDGIPFAPFNKSDRVGRISDWNQSYNRFHRGNQRRQFGQGSSELFSFTHMGDEDSFNLVDNTPKFKPRDGRRRFKKFSVHNRRRRGRGYRAWGRRSGGKRGGKNGRYGRRRWYNYTPDLKEPSIRISENWEAKTEIDFEDIRRLAFNPAEPENLVQCGALDMYNPAYDLVSPRSSVNLKRFPRRQHFTATTSQDPVLQRLIDEKAGTAYGTDTIFGLLMASTRSVQSWDLIVRRVGESVIFDKRPDSRIDYLTVNENWNEVLETDEKSVNHPEKLSEEATSIGHNFSQQVLREADGKQIRQHKFKDPNPFADAVTPGNEAASVAYRYRRWNLGDIDVVSRCALNAYSASKGRKSLLLCKALNEFDSKMSGGIDWRQKLEQQIGAVLANETKNNSCKLIRWTAEMELSGADELRLGFVSRTHRKDNKGHAILKSQRFKRNAFAASIKVRPSNLWGVLQRIIKTCLALDEGTYLLLKDPNEQKLVIFDVAGDDLDSPIDE